KVPRSGGAGTGTQRGVDTVGLEPKRGGHCGESDGHGEGVLAEDAQDGTVWVKWDNGNTGYYNATEAKMDLEYVHTLAEWEAMRATCAKRCAAKKAEDQRLCRERCRREREELLRQERERSRAASKEELLSAAKSRLAALEGEVLTLKARVEALERENAVLRGQGDKRQNSSISVDGVSLSFEE
ncbi:hypothetical protein KIPB_010436, partial [Kipferlia bialata]